MAFAFFIFLASLLGVISLFGVKEWELRREKVLVPVLRDKADQWALRLQELLVAFQKDLEKLLPETIHAFRLVIHELALTAAALLRFLSQQAHRFADFVSHKHSFTRRAPRSEFLQKVIEHKNGNGMERE